MRNGIGNMNQAGDNIYPLTDRSAGDSPFYDVAPSTIPWTRPGDYIPTVPTPQGLPVGSNPTPTSTPTGAPVQQTGAVQVEEKSNTGLIILAVLAVIYILK